MNRFDDAVSTCVWGPVNFLEPTNLLVWGMKKRFRRPSSFSRSPRTSEPHYAVIFIFTGGKQEQTTKKQKQKLWKGLKSCPLFCGLFVAQDNSPHDLVTHRKRDVLLSAGAIDKNLWLLQNRNKSSEVKNGR